MKSVSRGYLTLSDRDVRCDPWSVTMSGASPLADPVQIEDWSYFQTMEISVSVEVDVDKARVDLGLGPDARLGLVIIWTCTGTSLRGSSTISLLEGGQTTARLVLDGGNLRRDVRLECQVVLVQPSLAPTSQFAPDAPGAILWAAARVVKLEGDGARMPILAVSFSRYLTSASAGAMWWLRIEGDDLDAPADSALWLWINEESPIVMEMLNKPSSDKAKLTSHFMRLDLYRQLVDFGLKHDSFDLNTEYEEGSLGAVVAGPLRLFNADTATLRARYRDDPQRLEAELQARVGGLQ